jgi:Leucine-rich repeat (LRR) protein
MRRNHRTIYQLGALLGSALFALFLYTPAQAQTLSISDVSVTEGNAGTKSATFTVTVTPPSGGAVSVNYQTANQSAVVGSDYLYAGGTLNFAPNQPAQQINVQVIGETSTESDETFAVNLSSPSGAGIGKGTGIGRILDDDSLFTEIATTLQGTMDGRVSWGDYDADGDLDILLSGSISAGVFATVIYRNDAGTFVDAGAGLPASQTSSWGDFDNDGDLDVLLSYSWSSSYNRIYRNDAGTFTDINAGILPASATTSWADYDSDGDLDVLLVTGAVAWIYRNVAGAFTMRLTLPVTSSSAVAWGDYDNDDDLDILISGFDSSGTRFSSILRNDGASFVNIAAGLQPFSDGSASWGDIDNDGDLDVLLTGQPLNQGRQLYRNDAGTFSAWTASLPALFRGNAALGDLDNDGDLDAVITGSNGSAGVTAVFRNVGGGVFVNSGAALQATNASNAAWGDYDNDGDLDLVLTGYTGSAYVTKIYRNNHSAANTVPTAPTGLGASSVAAGLTTLSWTASSDTQTPSIGLTYNLRLSTTPGGINILSPMASTTTGWRQVPRLGGANHGTTATIKSLPAGVYYWSVQAIDTAFAGSPFAAEASFTPCGAALDRSSLAISPAGGTGALNLSTSPGCTWTAVSDSAWITVDPASGAGSGAINFTVAANSGSARAGTITIGTSTFTVSQGAWGSFADVGAGLPQLSDAALAWGDYDNDGDLDVALSGSTGTAYVSRVYRNDGSNALVDIGAGLEGVYRGSVAWGDYDNDSDLDLLLTGVSGAGLFSKLYRNDSGSFVAVTTALEPVGWESRGAWGDYDNDGDLDIVLTGGASPISIARVYRNDGGGVFTDVAAGLKGVGHGSVDWGDYDNDGDLDILLTGWSSDSERIDKLYRNDGADVFTEVTTSLVGVETSSAAWGDYDNDGDLDIALTGLSVGGTLVGKVYRNEGESGFVDTGVSLNPVNRSSVAWGDFDNDGDLDLVVSGCPTLDTGQSTRVYRNNGDGTFSWSAYGLPDLGFSALAWGDYDNDGDLDLVIAGTSTGGRVTSIYRNDTATTNTVPAAPTGLTVATGFDQATLGWTAPADTQTASEGLTYNLRVSTAPGGANILSPMASTSTGWRRVVQLGGAQHGTTAILKGLAIGTYYWSVQAVDTAFAGSPFAAESTFSYSCASIDPTSASVVAGGALGSVSVTAEAGCAWTAISNDAWIVVDSGTPGDGSGTVGYTVAANAGSARFGTITIAGQTFTVNQASGCTYAIDPTNASVAAGGATGSTSVTTETGCAWTAISNDAWIIVTSGTPGIGNGSVGYSVAANTGPARAGTITIAGLTFTINQANGCTYAIDPTSASVVAGGGTGSVSVTAEVGCAWTAISNDAWIVVDSGTPGDGSGTVGYTVAANTGPARSGTITIAGHAFTVNQAAGTFTLTVTKAGTGTGAVTSTPTGINCDPTCSASFTEGSVVTLTATPVAGSVFTNWSGDCTGTGACVVTMDAAKSVTASFALTVPASERAALIDLYNSTNGAGWTNRTNWRNAGDTDFNEPGTECMWYGVTCDGGQTTVQQLSSGTNTLVGTLPASLGNLTSLGDLSLSGNQLTGSIPTELGSLANLQALDLGDNQLTGSIPPQLGNLTSLQFLYLYNNQLSGSIPAQLGNLTDLQSLLLYGNLLTGSIPTELGNLTELRFLYLYDNQLTGSIPAQLGNLTNLQTLHLYNNQLTGSIPPDLGNLTNLQSLHLYTNHLTGSIPTAFGKLTELRHLHLYDNQLTGSIPPELGSLPDLSSLYLFGNQLTGSIPTELGNLTNLVSISLAGNQLTGSIPTAFGNLTDLHSLDLAGNQLTGSIPTELGNLTNLQYLYLAMNHLTGSIPMQLGNLTNLQYLNLSENQVAGSIPAVIGNLTNLQRLDLHSNQHTGEVPSTITNLTSLLAESSDFRYNGLSSSDPSVVTFLNDKQSGGEWQDTQTIAPSSLTTGLPGATSVPVTWAPITYAGDTGGYRVLYSTTAGGPYTVFGTTADKSASSLTVTGLSPSTTYHFVVQTVTDPHISNQNTVTSELSTEVSASTLAAYTLTVNLSGSGDGTVTSEPAGISCNPTCSATFAESTVVALTATPAVGSVFTAWSGDCASSGACVLTINAPKSVTATFAVTVPASERAALIDLYNSTNGAGWTNRTNWRNAGDTDFNEPGTECTWYGVTCNGEQNTVLQVNLDTNNLVGTLPASLGDLTNLLALELWRNQLMGSIPSELGALSNLETLQLGGNQFSGSIPSQLGNLARLRQLVLSANQLTGSIPPDLGSLSELLGLWLEGNNLAGSVPREVGNLGKLQILLLHSNQLSGSIPAELANLAHLRSLALDHNQLTGSIPPELGNLASLESLGLQDNQLTGSIPPGLANLTNLRYLYLSRNQLTGSIPAELGGLSNLQDLLLYENQLTGFIPTELGSLTDLQRLYLQSNQLAGSIPPELGKLASLQYLFLFENQLEGSIPPELGNLSNLQSLNLISNQLTGEVPSTITNLTGLTTSDSDFRLNGLSSSDPAVVTFLNDKQQGGDWQSTQTIAPSAVTLGTPLTTSIPVTWTPITYTGDTGGYRVLYSTTAGGPYTPSGMTADKSASSLTVTGLSPSTTYYFVVGTVTNPHANNQNTVTSELSTEVSAATLAVHTLTVDLSGSGDGTVTSEPAGISCNPTCSAAFAASSAVTLTATPAVDSVFTGWSGDCAGSGACVVTMDAARFVTATFAVTVPASERGALINLYNSTNGAGWTNRTNWRNVGDTDFNAPGTECTWHGVTCDAAHAHVIGLTLGVNRLSGPLPAELAQLAALQILDLSYNQLTGLIPDLSALTSLVRFDLYYNSTLTAAPIPDWLTSIPSLTYLSFHYTKRNGVIPDLHTLTNLQTLNLGNNSSLTAGPIPDWLTSMSSLTYLNLYNTRRNGVIPDLHTLTNLQTLNLGYNSSLTAGPIPDWLQTMTRLTSLDLYSTNRNGTIPAWLGGLTNLTGLYLWLNQLTGSIPAELGNLANLQYLDLNRNQLTGEITDLHTLTKLQDLDLYSNSTLDAGPIPDWLQSMTQLIDLDLSATRRTGAIPAWLGNLTNLRYLRLYSNQLTGEITDLHTLAKLQYLDLSLNSLLTAGPIPDWLQSMTQLYSLGLPGTNRTGAIPAWFGNLTNLQYLRLYSNQLTGSIPVQLGNLTRLQYFSLRSNQLAGEVPSTITNLTSLVTGDSDLRWNSLTSSDPAVVTFLNDKQTGGDWQGTQTIAPSSLVAGSPGATSVPLAWTPIAYTGDTGGYRVLYGTTAGGPYTLFGTTANKLASSFTVTGLSPSTTYYFVVQAVTNPHANNQNTVTSELSTEVSATTLAAFTLAVDLSGSGDGTVTSEPAGISCEPTCSAAFAESTAVTLTATPAIGSVNAGWSGEMCSGTGACVVTMSQARNVTATFALIWPTNEVVIGTHVPGINAPWTTDLVLHNLASGNATCQISFLRNSSSPVMYTLTLPEPEGVLVLHDIVASVFGFAGSGGLEVRCTTSVAVRSRISSSAGPGQSLAGFGSWGRLTTGAPVRIIGATENADMRTNLWLVNQGDDAATVRVDALNETGTQFGSGTYTLPARTYLVRSRIIASFTSASISNAVLVASLTSGSGPVAVIGSEVDNLSGDPATLAAMPAAGSTETLVMPAFRGSLSGAEQRSDLYVMNPGTSSATVQLELTLTDGTVVVQSVNIAAGNAVLWNDAIDTLFGLSSGTGVIRASSTTPILAQVRVWSPGVAGAFHEALPGLPESQLSGRLLRGSTWPGLSLDEVRLVTTGNAAASGAFAFTPPTTPTPAGSTRSPFSLPSAGAAVTASGTPPLSDGTSMGEQIVDGSAPFQAFSLQVNTTTGDPAIAPLSISEAPRPVIVASHSAGQITLDAYPRWSGTTWSWYEDGSAVPGGTTEQLLATTGSTYHVVATNSVFTGAGRSRPVAAALYSLSVSRNGAGTGSVVSSPAGISCPTACSADYITGAVVTLTATAETGSVFAGWTGEGCIGTAPCEVAMTQARTVVATFVPEVTLTVTRVGAGAGAVTSSPVGIDCGSDCSESYATGTVVTLTATAAAGSTFAGWSGEGCSRIGACEVTMSQARAVTAMFVSSVASAFYPLTPCRVFDTRVDSGSAAGAPVLGIGERRLFTIAGGCGVPLDATAISANLTVVGATAIGDLRVTGGHVLDTITSALSIPLSRARANNAVIELSANGDGTIAVTNPTAGTVHVILDVNGYLK